MNKSPNRCYTAGEKGRNVYDAIQVVLAATKIKSVTGNASYKDEDTDREHLFNLIIRVWLIGEKAKC